MGNKRTTKSIQANKFYGSLITSFIYHDRDYTTKDAEKSNTELVQQYL